MTGPLVSIVIPAYIADQRQAALLGETLATVDAQTCTSYEVLVIDDGSPVPAAPVVERHLQGQVIRQTNHGCAVARNTGIDAARGQYFVFLDADDHLLPGALDSGMRQLEAHPDAGFVVGRREEMTYEGDPVSWSIGPAPRERDLYETLLAFDWYIIPPSSVMFSRHAVESIGPFRDPWGADDLDFYLRAAWRYPGWYYDTPAVTRYRRYSTSSSRDGERMLASIREVYRRQWPVIEGDARLESAYHRGLARLTDIFIHCLVENVRDRLRARQWRRAFRSAAVFARERLRRSVGRPRPI
jgi:glycosyltransferase involved in cell wall biosynthesis